MPAESPQEALWRSLPEGLEPVDYALRARFLLEHVAAGERVLDVGCGEGGFTLALERAGTSPVGIELAEEPLRRARRRHPQLDLRLLDAGEPWQLEDASFDAVWAGEVIEHVADTAAWLSEVRRVLRSGGRLLASTPAHGRLELLRIALSRRAFASHFDPLSDHLRFYSRETLTALLEDFRFERVQVRSAGGAPWARRVLLAHAVRARH